MKLAFVFILSSTLVISLSFASVSSEDKPDWARKDIRDYSDADMERLLEQWEEGEEELPPEERPDHLKPQAGFDMSRLDINDPNSMLKMTKKNKPVMVFVNLRKSLSEQQVQERTAIWQQSMQNNHLVCDRYVIDTHRVIYMFKDGSQSWDAKDFLVDLDDVDEVNIDNQAYPGKHRSPDKNSKDEL